MGYSVLSMFCAATGFGRVTAVGAEVDLQKPAVEEARLLQAPVLDLRTRLAELLSEWPENANLIQLDAICSRLLGQRPTLLHPTHDTNLQSKACFCRIPVPVGLERLARELSRYWHLEMWHHIKEGPPDPVSVLFVFCWPFG